MITADDVYQAILATGPEGLAMAAITQLHKADPARPKVNFTERAAAGRHIHALLDAGAVEAVAHGVWAAVAGPDWSSGDPSSQRAANPAPQARPGVDLPTDQHRAITARPRTSRPPDGPLPVVPLDPALLEYATDEERLAWAVYQVTHTDDWRTWATSCFPQYATRPFAPHHEEFWEHVWAVERGRRSRPWVSIWSRDGAKSANVEMAVAALGARGQRRYGLYVGARQLAADDHLVSIGGLVTSPVFAATYPQMADRKVDKYGHSQGWRRNRLWTASGFVIDALGLDVAIRGIRLEEQRPDLIIFDDIDHEGDTPGTIEKKMRAITRAIIPVGSPDVVVIAVQNLIHSESIFARLASTGQPGEPDPATFLADRIVSGPIPAVYDLEYEDRTGPGGRPRVVITGGSPSWPGKGLEAEQGHLDNVGISAYLAEYQHEEPDLRGGMFDHLDFTDHGPIRIPEALVPALKRTIVTVDPAVTSTDKSDSCGIVVAALGADRVVYVLWAWEQVASPTEAMRVAITSAIEFGATTVVVETDQGGDTWKTVFSTVLKAVVDDLVVDNGGEIPDGLFLPRFDHEKAGSIGDSKRARIQRMRVDYEVGPRIRHVGGGAHVLERGLRRFPLYKPYDVVDACLVPGTEVATTAGPRRIEEVRSGDLVHTPMGPTPVSLAAQTGTDIEVYRAVLDDGSEIVGTFDHPVWTNELGWCPLGLLGRLESPAWKPLLRSPTEAGSIAGTRPLRTGTIGPTTRPPDREQAPPSRSTDRSTSTTTGPFPTAGTSITKITIPSTTPLTTLLSPPIPSTSPTTWPTMWPTTGNSHTWTGFDLWLASGTDPMPGASGIASTALVPGMAASGSSTDATCAGRPSRRGGDPTPTAQPVVATGRSSMTPSTWWTASAKSVAAPSSGTSTSGSSGSAGEPARRVVRVESVGSADVFNLEVPGPHSFIAGGLLVHNCFWARYWLGSKGGGDRMHGGQVRARAARGALPSSSPASLPGAHR